MCSLICVCTSCDVYTSVICLWYVHPVFMYVLYGVGVVCVTFLYQINIFVNKNLTRKAFPRNNLCNQVKAPEQIILLPLDNYYVS